MAMSAFEKAAQHVQRKLKNKRPMDQLRGEVSGSVKYIVHAGLRAVEPCVQRVRLKIEGRVLHCGRRKFYLTDEDVAQILQWKLEST